MNWGRSLILVFVVFAAFMGYLVYRASGTHFDLVSKEYYKDELRYQDKIDGFRNAAAMEAVQLRVDSTGILQIRFPEQMKGKPVQGSLWLYCKTDAGKDIHILLAEDTTGMRVINVSGKASGKYQAKLHWEVLRVPYEFEQEIIIP
jgi:hypothetical protein